MTQIIDSIEADAPLFDPNSWKLSNFQTELCEKARKMGSESFAPRAEKWDREASFPVENYEDLKKEGMLGICIPSSEGGIGADFKSYMLAAAEIGRYCGTTALTFNMHVCSCLWTGELADSL
ncbi:MAG: acyl-CoA dehydrogenase family protein, partial [SAR324 cluster bacterium]|nr:acyl-CoA dehydrogenase family protein [SAR324 cluster bacterium]